MKLRLMILLALLVAAPFLVAGGDSELEKRGRAAFADRDYVRGVTLYRELLATRAGAEDADRWAMMVVRGLFLERDHDAAAEAGEAFLAGRPESRYVEKVADLTARSLLLIGRGEEASAFIEASFSRLTGTKRRARISAYLLEAADRAFAGRAPKGPFDEGVRPDFARAVKLYAAALSVGVADVARPDVLLRYARAAMGAKGYGLALSLLKRRGGEDVEPLLLRVKALDALGRDAEAVDAVERIAALHPTSRLTPEALLITGRATDLLRVLNGYPDHARAPEAGLRAGHLLAKAGRTDEAVATFFRVSSGFPDSDLGPKAFLAAADSLREAGRFEEARTRYTEFLRTWPESPDWAAARDRLTRAWYAQGAALLKAEKPDEAAKVFARLRKAYPLSPLAPRSLEAEAVARPTAAAIPLLKELIARYPGSTEAPNASLTIALQLADRPGAVADAVAALKRTARVWPKTEAGRTATRLYVEMQAEKLLISLPAPVRPGETPALHIATRNLKELSGRVYRIDPAAYFEKHGSLAALANVMVEVIAPDAVFGHQVLDYEDHRRIEAEMPVPVEGEGAYIVVVEGGELRAVCLLLVSDLTLITKESPKGVLAFVQETSGEPLPGTAIHVRTNDGTALRAATGSDGTARLDFENRAGGIGVMAVRGDSIALEGFGGASREARGFASKVHLATDRSVYRPGDTVRYRALVRRAAGEFFETPAGEVVWAWFTDGAGNDLHMLKTTLSEFGSFSGEFELPADMPPGKYEIHVAFESKVSTFPLPVEAYRKPQIFLEVKPERLDYVRGEEVVLEFAARYAFGRPVAGLEIDVTLEERLDGRLRADTERRVVTDAGGRARITVPTHPGPDLTIGVEATFRDATRRAYVTHATVPVPSAAYRSALAVEQTRRFPGDEARLVLKTFDALGNPVAASGKIEVGRAPAGEGEPAYANLTTIPVETNAGGTTVVRHVLDRDGRYRFLFRSRDRAGREVTAAATLSVDDPEGRKRLTVRAARADLRVGGKLTVEVGSPEASGYALLTFEGEEVYGHRVVRLGRGTTRVEEIVRARFVPDIRIRLAMAAGADLWQGEDRVRVHEALTVEVTPDKEEYAPGELCRLLVRTLDEAGEPVPAEVAVAVVDEAVFRIRADATPDLRATFMPAERRDLVRTGSSLDYRYSGVTGRISLDLIAERERRKAPAPKVSVMLEVDSLDDAPFEGESDNAPIGIGGGAGGAFSGRGGHRNLKAMGGGKAMAERLFPTRKDFADTAFFRASVVTGADGTAVVEFTLPDDLTEWRVTARGGTHGNAFGETRSKVLTARPLVVRAALPRILREGDALTAAAGVVNGTGEDIRATVVTTPAREGAPTTRVVEIPAGEERAVDWPLPTLAPGEATFTARVTTEGMAEDAEERKLAVRPYGVAWRDGFSGATGKPGERVLVLPEDYVPGTEKLTLNVADSFFRAALQGNEELRTFPHGCTEQTVNRVYPALELAQVGKELGLGRALRVPALERTVLAGVRRLGYLQNKEGLWGWWKNGGTDPEMTAYALLALGRAKEAGYPVSQTALDRAEKALPKVISRFSDPDRRAFLLFGRSRAFGVDLETLAHAFAGRERLGPRGLAWLALAYEPFGETTQYGILVAEIESRLAAGFPKDAETLGWTLAAVAGRDARSGTVLELALQLARLRRGRGFGTTRETGAAVLGLARAARGIGVAGNSVTISVKINGNGVKHLASHWIQGTYDVPTRELRPGRNRIEVVSSGDRLHLYSVALSCVRRKAPETESPIVVTRSYSLVPMDAGGDLTRLRPKSVRKEPVVDAVRVGEMVRVTLRLKAEGLRHFVLEDPLPGGFEPVAGSETGPFSATSRFDDRLFFFFENPGKEVVVSYLAASEAPGGVRVPPAAAYAMYRPSVSAYSGEHRFTVAGAGEELDRDPTIGLTADGLLSTATAEAEAGRHESAIRHVEALLDRYELRPVSRGRALRGLAKSLAALGRHEEMLAAWDRLFAEVPTFRAGVTDLVLRAASFRAVGRHGDAVGALQRAIGLLFAADRKAPEALGGRLSIGGKKLERELCELYPFTAYTEAGARGLVAIHLEVYGELLTPEDLEPVTEYLALYPVSIGAPWIAHAVARALLESGHYEAAESWSRRFLDRYPKHRLTDDEGWFLAYSLFAQDRLAEAEAVAKACLAKTFTNERGERGPTSFAKNLKHLLAQVAHVTGRLDEAIALYEEIAEDTVDAREALLLLRERRLEIAGVTRGLVGGHVKLTGLVKNLSSAQVDLYPIDLFVYFALQKDVGKIASLNLDGIPATLRREVAFPGAEDRREREVELSLGTLDPGVYLAVAKAGGIRTRGIVIVSDLEARIRRFAGGVRVVVTDRKTGAPIPAAHVKVALGGELVGEGVTDARGVFQAETEEKGRVSAVAGKAPQYALATD